MLTHAFISCSHPSTLIHDWQTKVSRMLKNCFTSVTSLILCCAVFPTLVSCLCPCLLVAPRVCAGQVELLVDQKVKLLKVCLWWWLIRYTVKVALACLSIEVGNPCAMGVQRVCRVSTKSQTTPVVSQISPPSTREEDILLLEGNLHTLRARWHKVVSPCPHRSAFVYDAVTSFVVYHF